MGGIGKLVHRRDKAGANLIDETLADAVLQSRQHRIALQILVRASEQGRIAYSGGSGMKIYARCVWHGEEDRAFGRWKPERIGL